ncbi:MAG: molybdate ABC transporter substrate-binding protein [Chloroflexota bacterium]
MKLPSILRSILPLTLLLAGCAPASAPTAASPAAPTSTTAAARPVDLNVFAAASLTEAFGELGPLFEAAHPGVTVVFNFAGSQQLAQQINEGAPADVFASASQKPLQAVISAGGILTGTQQIFARNRLVVIFPKDNPSKLAQLRDLAGPGLKLVLAAKEVPVGQYALDFLDKAAADPALGATFKDGVLGNVVSYEDNVKAVVAKVALGEADAGIVYTTDILGANAAQLAWIEIPDALNVIAAYPIAALAASRSPDLAQAFIDLVLSPQGQAVLASDNFMPAAGK